MAGSRRLEARTGKTVITQKNAVELNRLLADVIEKVAEIEE